MSQAMAPPTVTCRVPGQHRDPQSQRQPRLHQLVEVHPGVDVDGAVVGVDRVDAVQAADDDEAAAVLALSP